MTDSIDLDELDVAVDEEDEQPKRGDWFWENDDDAGDRSDRPTATDPGAAAGGDSAGGDAAGDDAGPDLGSGANTDAASGADHSDDAADATDAAGATAAGDGSDGWRSGAARSEELGADEPEPTTYDDDLGADLESSPPRVPYADDDKPVGIPRAEGGGGGVPADAREEATHEQPAAAGPHGGGASEMTLAFSYRAVRGLANLHAALADAETWTDYVGIVGDVDAHVINKFQRDNRLDLDFFNGTGTGPGERLAAVGPNSMFYAERMVLVGVESAGERAWAKRADWEFIPLAEAAAASGWELDADDTEDSGDSESGGDDDDATDGDGDDTHDDTVATDGDGTDGDSDTTRDETVSGAE